MCHTSESHDRKPIARERRIMKNHLLYQPTRSSRAETAVFVGLGLVGLFSVLLAAVSMSNFVQGKDKVVASLSGNSPAAYRSIPGVRYISSGQWLADTKTLIAMARWVLEPEIAMTNPAIAPGNASNVNAAISTNSTGTTPKA